MKRLFSAILVLFVIHFECLSIYLVGTTVYDMGFVFVESLLAVNLFLKTLLLDQKSYSRGITIVFNNEEQSKAFHCAFDQWKKEASVQGLFGNLQMISV